MENKVPSTANRALHKPFAPLSLVILWNSCKNVHTFRADRQSVEQSALSKRSASKQPALFTNASPVGLIPRPTGGLRARRD
jgi:hypothetical protein